MDLKTHARRLLIICNFFFVLTGIIIISVGVSVKEHFNEQVTFLDNRYFYASDLLIVVGVVIFVIAFFGCCGALKENVCMTTTFNTFLIVICLLEILIGVGGFLLKNRTEEVLSDSLKKTMVEYNDKNHNETAAIWDAIQHQFRCCGIDNATDWAKMNVTKGDDLPLSCCDIPAGIIGNFSCTEQSPFRHQFGCLEKFTDYIEGHSVQMAAVGFSLAFIQLLGICLSCYLVKHIRSDYETV